MRILTVLALAALPALVGAQDAKKPDPSKIRVEAFGCVKGSTLTENPSRRWRLRGPKALMNRIKEQRKREVKIVGTTKSLESGMAIGNTRLGKANIFIGGGSANTARDPLPELPTIDVEAFEITGESCQ